MADARGASHRRRILLGQLGARGDCVYATTVARQIKHDYPGCHLTWAVGSMARSIVEGNPDVDEIWEVPVANHAQMMEAWDAFRKQAEERLKRGDFDEMFLTQVYPDNFGNYDGTVRASIFRGYPRPIRVPVTPVIRLSEEELRQTRAFAERHGLSGRAFVILFECGAGSGQTFVTPEFAREAARLITTRHPDAAVVLSSSMPLDDAHPAIIDGSTLPFKCNAELTRYCHLLIGCSSGITWLSTSDAAVRLPMIQLLRKSTSVFASVVHDHERFGLSTADVIEMTDCIPEHVADCVDAIRARGLAEARRAFHEEIPLDFKFYAEVINASWPRGGAAMATRSLCRAIGRYGARPQLFSAFLGLLAGRLRRS